MIAIAPEVRVPRGALPKRELASFVREVCTAIPLAGEVSVLLTTDAAVQALNRGFRGQDKPTDVLSFPAVPADFCGAPELAGDLAISIDTAARQAEQFGHTLLLEVKVLLLHGLLHLAGYDHEQDSGRMARRERTLRVRFGLPSGLIQRSIRLSVSATATVTNRQPRMGARHPARKRPPTAAAR